MRALLPLTDADLVAVLGHGHVGTELDEEWSVLFDDGSRTRLSLHTAIDVHDRALSRGRSATLCRRFATDWEEVDDVHALRDQADDSRRRHDVSDHVLTCTVRVDVGASDDAAVR